MLTALLQFYRKRRHASWAVGALLFAVFIFAAFRLTGRGEIQYFTAEVTRGDIVQIVNATGSIDAVTTVEVGSQVTGMISALNADFNSVVKRGQVIARIEAAPFEARVLQAEADLASAQASLHGLAADNAVALANLSKARAAVREAELNLDRSTQLVGQGITSPQQHETVQLGHETAQANLEAAKAQVSQLTSREAQAQAQIRQRQAQLEQARLNLAHTIIRAPIDGTVIARNVDTGQTVAASLSAPVLFTIAQDLTQMLVYAKTDESDVGKIVEDAEVTFNVDSFPGEDFRGRIRQVRMNATVIQNVVTYDTVIEFENPSRRLLPGMTAYVTIPVGAAREVVKIPNGALRFAPEIPDEQLSALIEQYGLGQRPGPPREKLELAEKTGAKDEAGKGDESADRGAGSNGGDSSGNMRERFRNASPAERARMRQQMGQHRRQGGERKVRNDARVTWQRVWKLDPNQNLLPLDIKVGLTDYTFTALIEGELEEGEQLVIGQTKGPGGSGGSRSLRRSMRRF